MQSIVDNTWSLSLAAPRLECGLMYKTPSGVLDTGQRTPISSPKLFKGSGRGTNVHLFYMAWHCNACCSLFERSRLANKVVRSPGVLKIIIFIVNGIWE